MRHAAAIYAARRQVDKHAAEDRMIARIDALRARERRIAADDDVIDLEEYRDRQCDD